MSSEKTERVGFFGRCMECASRSQRIRIELIEDNSVAVLMSTNVNLDPELMARLTKQPGKNTDTKQIERGLPNQPVNSKRCMIF